MFRPINTLGQMQHSNIDPLLVCFFLQCLDFFFLASGFEAGPLQGPAAFQPAFNHDSFDPDPSNNMGFFYQPPTLPYALHQEAMPQYHENTPSVGCLAEVSGPGTPLS